MEGPKTEKEDDFSMWKGQRQKKRKIIPRGRARDRQRGRLFQVQDFSMWKVQRQRGKLFHGRAK